MATETSNEPAIKIKTPPFETKVHLPQLVGSFTYTKKGKLRLDQGAKYFCLLNECKGCFEVKVHFGRHVNAKKIKYDALKDGIHIDTLQDTHKYKLFVPYPKGLTLKIPENPEAKWHCGKLSAMLAIIDYDPKLIKGSVKINKSAVTQTKAEKRAIAQKEERQKQKEKEAKNKSVTKKRKLTLDALNKRIASQNKEALKAPPTKKRKLNKKPKKTKKEKTEKKEEGKTVTNATNDREMSKDAQYKLIDGVVDKMNAQIQQKISKENEKNLEIQNYLKQKAEKKEAKKHRKEEFRKKLLERKESKKKTKKKKKTPVS